MKVKAKCRALTIKVEKRKRKMKSKIKKRSKSKSKRKIRNQFATVGLSYSRVQDLTLNPLPNHNVVAIG
jgi:hypothetical protein